VIEKSAVRVPWLFRHQQHARRDGSARAALAAPLFDRFGVDLVVQGHNHQCERTDMGTEIDRVDSPARQGGGPGAATAATPSPWRVHTASELSVPGYVSV
jgi:hypothetical protein